MQKIDEIKLLTTQIVADQDGYEAEITTQRTVFAEIKSVRRSEFFLALQLGIEETIVFCIWLHDFNNEKQLIYNNQKYKIIRTYIDGSEKIELSCAEIRK